LILSLTGRSIDTMKTLFLRSLLLWLILIPAALIALMVEWLTGWSDSPVPWWIGAAVWWPLLYLLIKLEGQPTPMGRWLSKTLGPILP
jgi:hypothetical protein